MDQGGALSTRRGFTCVPADAGEVTGVRDSLPHRLGHDTVTFHIGDPSQSGFQFGNQNSARPGIKETSGNYSYTSDPPRETWGSPRNVR